MSEELVKKESTAIAVPSYAEEYHGAGFENETLADVKIPFLNMLQGLSPIVVEEKAKAGQFFNTVSNELYDKTGFLFVPSCFDHCYVEWVPRKAGGGFRGRHEVNSKTVASGKPDIENKFIKVIENGNQLVETHYLYGVVCAEDAEPEYMAMMGFASTKISPYRSWRGRLAQFAPKDANGKRFKPPLFSHLVRISSEMDENEKGKYYIPKITPALNNSLAESLIAENDERFQMAQIFRNLVLSGKAKVDLNQQNAQGGDESTEIPF